MADITVVGVPTSRKSPGRYFKTYPGTSGVGGTGQLDCVLVGQILAVGSSMSAGEVERCRNVDEAKDLAGQGSECHLMAKGFFDVNAGGVLYLGALTAGTVVSTRTVTFANAATEDGSYYIWCNGNKYTLTIDNGDTIANMADNLHAGLIAESWYGDLPFTSATDGVSVVTFTTKNLGPQSEWAVDPIYQSVLDLPGTTTAVLAAVGASAGNDPTVTAVVTSLTPTDYDYIGWSSIDSTGITAIKAYISTAVGPLIGFRQQSVFGSTDSYANTLTMAQTNTNDRRVSVAWSQSDRETYFETIGRVVGCRALYEGSDPAEPYNSRDLTGYRAHHLTSGYISRAEAEDCYNNGITPVMVSSGDGQIERSVTSYSLDVATPDYSCLDTSAVTIVDYVADILDAVFAVRFKNMKVAADYTDPTDTPRGVATPGMVKDVIYQELKKLQGRAIVGDVEPYKDQIDASVDSVATGRLNYECPVPTLAGLYQLAGNIRGF